MFRRSSRASSPIRIWVDQIGYRTEGNKMAVIASDHASPDDLRIELRDEKTESRGLEARRPSHGADEIRPRQ